MVGAGVRAGMRGTVAGGEPVEEWDGTVLVVAARAFVPTDAGTLTAVAVCYSGWMDRTCGFCGGARPVALRSVRFAGHV